MQPKVPSTERVVRCRRINAYRTVDAHTTCPYCFGEEAEILSEQYERFCSFDPKVDPIVYGFPGGTERDTNG